MALDEAQAEEVLDEGAIESTRVRPVETVDRHDVAEQGCSGPALEVAALALATLEQNELLERLDGAEVVLDDMADQGTDRLGRGAESDAAESAVERSSRFIVVVQVVGNDLAVGDGLGIATVMGTGRSRWRRCFSQATWTAPRSRGSLDRTSATASAKTASP